jgi:putative acetyltransferase
MPRISRLPEDFVIRTATAADGDAIDRVVRAAFAQTEFGDQGEAELVRMLEADGDIVVSLVAERDGSVIGHALFSRMTAEMTCSFTSAPSNAPGCPRSKRTSA